MPTLCYICISKILGFFFFLETKDKVIPFIKQKLKESAGFHLSSVEKKKGSRSIILALTERPGYFTQKQDHVDPQQIFQRARQTSKCLLALHKRSLTTSTNSFPQGEKHPSKLGMRGKSDCCLIRILPEANYKGLPQASNGLRILNLSLATAKESGVVILQSVALWVAIKNSDEEST